MKKSLRKLLLAGMLVLALAGLGVGGASANHMGLRHISPVRIVNDGLNAGAAPSVAAAPKLSPIRVANDPAASSQAVAAKVVGYRYSPMRMVNDSFDAQGNLIR